MTKKKFTPHHINATPDDLAGNRGLGRYVLLPGSDGRAKEIAEHFKQHSVKTHGRGHHLHLGTIDVGAKKIDVATIASGMGCSSMEIILHELYCLGAKRFLRVGTAGSLQPGRVSVSDMVNVQGSVRDEQTSLDYMPLAMPAIASIDYVVAINQAIKHLKLQKKTHLGVVHCKSSFYAREFAAGPEAKENQAYIGLLRDCGVLATEMETATLFIQTQYYNYQQSLLGTGPHHRVLSGAILGIVSEPPKHFASTNQIKLIEEKMIQLALESVRQLHLLDLTS